MRPTRSQLLVPRQTITRRIVGTPEHVRRTVALAQASGRLVSASPWDETPEGYQVTVTLLDREEPTPVPRPRRWPVLAAIGSAAATALGVAAYAAIQLVNAVIDALPVIGGGLLLLGLVAVLARGRSGRTFTFTGTGRLD